MKLSRGDDAQWVALADAVVPLLRLAVRNVAQLEGALANDTGALLLGLVVALSKRDGRYLRRMAAVALGEGRRS